jgi:hypothetical protein
LITIAVGSGTSQAGSLLGNSFDGTLYDVNQTTGAATNGRNTGLSNVVGIAARSDGALFGLTAMGGSPQPFALYQINAVSGASTLVGLTGLTGITEGDLGFDPISGRLYGLQETDLNFNRGLFVINTSTGAATIVGDINAPGSDLSALAFDSTGRLYIVDRFGFLLNVNPTNGQVLSEIPLSHPLGTTAGMAFDPGTGIAYVADGGGGGTNTLYTLNTSTGLLTPIGSTGLANGLAGLTFEGLGTPIPEPASFMSGVTAAVMVGLTLHLCARRAHALGDSTRIGMGLEDCP